MVNGNINSEIKNLNIKKRSIVSRDLGTEIDYYHQDCWLRYKHFNWVIYHVVLEEIMNIKYMIIANVLVSYFEVY